MLVYTSRLTDHERQALAQLATGLRSIAWHALTGQLADVLDQWAQALPGRTLDTATLDQQAQQQSAAWQRMDGYDQSVCEARFRAMRECTFAARTAGQGMPESFTGNLADATRALRTAGAVLPA